MTISTEARIWLESQQGEFMRPFTDYFTADEALEYAGGQCHDGNPDPEDYGAGWYARLSAPGYLDCTDWQGPYDSEDEALESLYWSCGE